MVVYTPDFPKKLGKALLTDIKLEFEEFVRAAAGERENPYDYLEGVRQPYAFIKFGGIIRQEPQAHHSGL